MYKAEVKNLNFYYGNFHALKDISLAFGDKTVTALIGPSGCGKSTFLRLFNRMNDLFEQVKIEGDVMVNGQNVYAKEIMADQLRKSIGMVFQKPNPFPKTIFENVAYGLRVNGLKDPNLVEENVVTALNKAALWEEVKDKLKKPAFSLTAGQQQRLCIARALAVDPTLLLMDEPASMLDPYSTAKIEELIHELKKQYAIIIVPHNLQQAGRISDFTAFLFLGELVEHNETRTMFLNPYDERTQNYITGRFG